MQTETFYSHGKLLLTGEYLVLDGAKALAIPCKYGQTLEVTPTQNPYSRWMSYDEKNHVWLDLKFKMHEALSEVNKGQAEAEIRLFDIFKQINILNPGLCSTNFNFETRLEFPRDWGLGTSSTLISNLSQWANVDAYQLLQHTFGGSGYDVACAMSSSALTFQLDLNKSPKVEPATFPDALKPYTYFVHLGEKQNSRSAIKSYRANTPSNLNTKISEVSSLSYDFQKASSLQEGQDVIKQHEEMLSEVLGIDPIKSRLFADFDGEIKSLGAWGGDFVLVLSQTNPRDYFEKKGYKTLLTFKEMAL